MLIFDEFSSPVSLSVLLAAEGYEVILGRNEQQVQDALVNGSKPDLVLLEMQVNAINILQLIRSTQPQIPVILMADTSLRNLAFESKEFGAWEVLLKPFDFRLLKRLLPRAMYKSALAS